MVVLFCCVVLSVLSSIAILLFGFTLPFSLKFMRLLVYMSVVCKLSFTGHSHLLSEEVSELITVQYNSYLIIYRNILDEGPGVL